MSTVNLQIVNGMAGFITVKYNGNQNRMDRNMNYSIRDFDTGKSLEIANSNNPGDPRVFQEGYFRGNTMLKCEARGNDLQIEERPM